MWLTYPLFGFNEQLRYYRESPNQDFFRPTPKIVTHAKTDAKKIDPHKNIFVSCNPRKNYDPCKKYFDPWNPHVTHVTMQPPQFSRLSRCQSGLTQN